MQNFGLSVEKPNTSFYPRNSIPAAKHDERSASRDESTQFPLNEVLLRINKKITNT